MVLLFSDRLTFQFEYDENPAKTCTSLSDKLDKYEYRLISSKEIQQIVYSLHKKKITKIVSNKIIKLL